MPAEHTFQWILLATLGVSYATRCLARWMKGKSFKDAPLPCVIVMLAWTAILVSSAYGLTPTYAHLAIPEDWRWAGFALMLVAVAISIIDWADLYADRMALNAAMHADYGSHRLELNSSFVSFALCSFGAFLLSADYCVLAASFIALLAMGAWVRHDYPRPA